MGTNHVFSNLKQMLAKEKLRVQGLQTAIHVREAIEKNQSLDTLTNFAAKQFYIDLGLKKIDLPN